MITFDFLLPVLPLESFSFNQLLIAPTVLKTLDAESTRIFLEINLA